MTPLMRIFVTTCLLTMACNQINAQAQEANEMQSLHWVINTAPPFHILEGQYAGQGICDVLIDVLDDALPELATKRTVLPQTRIRQQFQRNENQCFPCMIYRPTPGETIQSEPTHFYAPHGIITTQEKAEQITQQHGNPVRLGSLVHDRNFRFGYPAGRHYPALHDILEQARQSHLNPVAHSGENATVAILSMIKKNRIDYTIEYQILQQFDHKTTDDSPLVFLEIAETQDQYVLGAIGCTNNAWGEAAIKHINRVLPQVQQHPDFLDVLDLWFTDKVGNQEYRQLLQQRVWHTTEDHP